MPEAHSLEGWGDARAFDGTVTIMQPLIAPLYEGATAHRSARRVHHAQTGSRSRRSGEGLLDARARRQIAGWTIADATASRSRTPTASGSHALHDGFIVGPAAIRTRTARSR